MTECTASDRINALQVANDILKGYAEYCHQPAKDFTEEVVTLAEGFIQWAENPNEIRKEDVLFNFFSNEKASL